MTFKNRFYPHLLPQDIPVWERYLNAHGDEYLRFEYDIRVGKGRSAPLYYPPPIRKMALDLSMRRIDAVGFASGVITIIEITRQAGLKAIGQLITYPVLYQNTYHPTMPLTTLLVAEELRSDVEPALKVAGIPWILLPAPGTR